MKGLRALFPLQTTTILYFGPGVVFGGSLLNGMEAESLSDSTASLPSISLAYSNASLLWTRKKVPPEPGILTSMVPSYPSYRSSISYGFSYMVNLTRLITIPDKAKALVRTPWDALKTISANISANSALSCSGYSNLLLYPLLCLIVSQRSKM